MLSAFTKQNNHQAKKMLRNGVSTPVAAASVAPSSSSSGPPTTTTTTTTRGSMVDSTIRRLREVGVNLLAIDFDLTLIDVHTGGRWEGSAEELSEHVRSEFRQLLCACCETSSAAAPTTSGEPKGRDDGSDNNTKSHQIHVAIVTFSAQVKLVRRVVEAVVGPDCAARIPIRGADRSWSYAGGGSQERKQPFIASAVEELEQSGDVEITKATTVLIDDDRKNVRCALEDGVRAIWLNPDKPHRVLQDLSKIV